MTPSSKDAATAAKMISDAEPYWAEDNPYRNVINVGPDGRDIDAPRDSRGFADIFTADTLADKPVPPREWHVEGLVPARTVTLLNGDGGTGKSLLALQLAAATTQGGFWAGYAVKQGPALYLSAEDDEDELHRRLADIAQAANVALADLGDLSVKALAGKDAILATPQGKSNVLKWTAQLVELERNIRAIKPAIYIIDTLADVFGGEENNRAQARQFISFLRGLCINYSTTALVLAHPSLAGMASGSGSSGSTAWSNSVRSRLYLDRVKSSDGEEGDPDTRALKTMKSNYGPVGGEIRLRWQAGAFKPVLSGDNSFVAIAADTKAERVFLSLVEAYADEGRHVGATPAANYAPTVFASDSRAEGVKKSGFVNAMNKLFTAGKIRIEEFGRPSRRLKRIVVVPGGQSDAE